MSLLVTHETDNNEREESNLLDSLNQSPGNRMKMENKQLCQDNEEDQFIDNVEQMLNQPSNRKMSNNEILLQAQVIELQMKCNSLAVMNQRLAKKLELDADIDMSVEKGEENSCLAGDITEMQNQFLEIQEILASYRSQLNSYQKEISEQEKSNKTKINALNRNIKQFEEELFLREKQNIDITKENSLLKNKNQELILEIENLSIQYENLKKKSSLSMKSYKNSYRVSIDDDSELSDHLEKQFCISEMEKIINQLAKEVEYQRSVNKKLGEEIKRLNVQLTKEQKKIQKKNQEKFLLEKKILRMMKTRAEENYEGKLYELEYGEEPIERRARQIHVKSISSNGLESNRQSNVKEEYYMQEKQKNKKQLNKEVGKASILRKNAVLHRYLLEQFLQRPSNQKSQLLSLYSAQKILQLYSKSQNQTQNLIEINGKNLQLYNITFDNLDLMRVRILHGHQSNRYVSTEEYLVSTLNIISTILHPYCFKQIEAIIETMRGMKGKVRSVRPLEQAIERYKEQRR